MTELRVFSVFYLLMRIELTLFHTRLRGNSFSQPSLHQLFHFFSHISYVSLRTHWCVPGWPTSLLAGLAGCWGETLPSSRWLLFAAMIQAERHFNSPHLLSEVGYDEHRLPPVFTDSVTQNVSSLPLFWESSHPAQSFLVTPADPFLSISAPGCQRLGGQPDWKVLWLSPKKIWISTGKNGST